MPKIICKRFYGDDGIESHYRTKYYRWYDGARASVGSRSDAACMDEATAKTVCAQLNTIAGTGWQVMDQEAVVKRDRKPPKEAPREATP